MAEDVKGYEARHRGGGHYAVMDGDNVVVSGLDREEADQFNDADEDARRQTIERYRNGEQGDADRTAESTDEGGGDDTAGGNGDATAEGGGDTASDRQGAAGTATTDRQLEEGDEVDTPVTRQGDAVMADDADPELAQPEGRPVGNLANTNVQRAPQPLARRRSADDGPRRRGR